MRENEAQQRGEQLREEHSWEGVVWSVWEAELSVWPSREPRESYAQEAGGNRPGVCGLQDLGLSFTMESYRRLLSKGVTSDLCFEKIAWISAQRTNWRGAEKLCGHCSG